VPRKIITLTFDKKAVANLDLTNLYYLKEDLWRSFEENGLGSVE